MLLLGGSRGRLSQVGTLLHWWGRGHAWGAGSSHSACQHSRQWACLHSVMMSLKTKLDRCPRSSSGARAHSPFWEAVMVLVCLALEAFLRQPGGSVPGHHELDTRRGGRGFALQAQEDPPRSAAGPRLRGVFSSFPQSARCAVLCS